MEGLQMDRGDTGDTGDADHPDHTDCIISQFEAESDLSLMQGLQDMPGNDGNEDSIPELDDITLIHIMDIRTHFSQLRSIIEKKIGNSLSDYQFWLQDSKRLENHRSLVDHCVTPSGPVQVNIQIRPPLKRINIMDVLSAEGYNADDEALSDRHSPNSPKPEADERITFKLMAKGEDDADDANASEMNVGKYVKWVPDPAFKADQVRLNIPTDPCLWSPHQVKYWIQWAVRQFNLTNIKLSDWNMSGEDLCSLSREQFKTKCPLDPNGLFWTHYELLRSCKFIAIVLNKDQLKEGTVKQESPIITKKKTKMLSQIEMKPSQLSNMSYVRNGNNGQIQLWQFLLELLTSPEHTNIIQWIGNNGEFKLLNPDMVSKLWGLRKHKPTMNYEKLSRALRYYYDGHMISKVHNKRFVYRFVCDLKQLIGYDASDLAKRVNMASRDPKNPNLVCDML